VADERDERADADATACLMIRDAFVLMMRDDDGKRLI